MKRSASILAWNFFALMVTVAVISGCQNIPTTNPKVVSSEISERYDISPDLDNCYEGSLKTSEKVKVLNYLNYVRGLHGLQPVVYDTSGDYECAKGALMIAANGFPIDTPSVYERCYTDAAAIGLYTSLQESYGFNANYPFPTSESVLRSWLNDTSAVNSLRRDMLDPFLKKISFGRVDHILAGGQGTSGVLLKVRFSPEEDQDISGTTTEMVALPWHDYPDDLFQSGNRMSFSVITDRTYRYSNDNVDYSRATVRIADNTGLSITPIDLQFDNFYYGIPNNLSWYAFVRPRTHYTVNIKNVLVDGVARDYEYWFATGN